jgi:hypothetical protein
LPLRQLYAAPAPTTSSETWFSLIRAAPGYRSGPDRKRRQLAERVEQVQFAAAAFSLQREVLLPPSGAT